MFPLPNAVLFPGGLLPLHVFEPRYLTMIRDALGTHRALAVVQLVSVTDADERRQPLIAAIAGAGTIVEHRELPDGRMNILLRGEARVRLDELPFVPPYRRAKAEILLDEPGAVSREDATALLAVASAFAARVRAQNTEFDFRVPASIPPEKAADLVGHYLIIDAEARQKLLELRDVRARTQLAMEIIANQHVEIAGSRPPASN